LARAGVPRVAGINRAKLAAAADARSIPGKSESLFDVITAEVARARIERCRSAVLKPTPSLNAPWTETKRLYLMQMLRSPSAKNDKAEAYRRKSLCT